MNDNGRHISSSRGQKWGPRFNAVHRIFLAPFQLLDSLFYAAFCFHDATQAYYSLHSGRKGVAFLRKREAIKNELLGKKQDQVKISWKRIEFTEFINEPVSSSSTWSFSVVAVVYLIHVHGHLFILLYHYVKQTLKSYIIKINLLYFGQHHYSVYI